jgi:catechol 2,3-dioxygenase-like lactoylglutathione lyase family enzyme
MIDRLSKLDVITLFTEDLPATKAFYQEVFGLKVIWEDADSAVVQLENLMINLLEVSNAPTLVEPVPVAEQQAGTRLLLTIEVEDTDVACAELERHGVKLLNGPIDRPWGRRTAAFADPAGNVWEVAAAIPKE